MPNNKGYTLVEMMIVLMIIGIIVSVTYPSLSRAYDTTNENDREKQEYVVNRALKEYYALTGAYPSQGSLASDLTQETGVILNTSKYQYTYTLIGIPSIHVDLIKKNSL